MAWWKRLAWRPASTLKRGAVVAALAGLFLLGVGIGSGGTLLLAVSYGVIFLACMIPPTVEWRNSIPRFDAAQPDTAPEGSGGIDLDFGHEQRVWIEPERPGVH
jgi:hypothetical protein